VEPAADAEGDGVMGMCGRKPRKTLGTFQSPWIQSLARLVESQSKPTLIRWACRYAEARILLIYECAYPGDLRPREALANSVGWLEGRVKYVDAKRTDNDVHAAATEAEGNPAAQAAARACAHAALSIHVAAHCLGLAFYGCAAVAQVQAGSRAGPDALDALASEECAKMEAALRSVAVEAEANPAHIDWKLWNHMIR
jgi:hypothetical protein